MSAAPKIETKAALLARLANATTWDEMWALSREADAAGERGDLAQAEYDGFEQAFEARASLLPPDPTVAQRVADSASREIGTYRRHRLADGRVRRPLR